MVLKIDFYNLHYEKFTDGTVKCIEDEIPFDVPDGWTWCRFQDVFNICSSKRVLQADWKNEGIPFYRAREIVKLSNNGYVDNDLFISNEHYLDLREFLCDSLLSLQYPISKTQPSSQIWLGILFFWLLYK